MNKFLAIVVLAAIGTAIMFLIGYAFDVMEVNTGGKWLGIVLGIAAASYFVTGFIAGLWTGQVGPGISAAIIVLVINNTIVSFAFGSFFQSDVLGIVAVVRSNVLGIIVAVVFALFLSSLGASFGKVVRPSGNKAEKRST